MSFKVRPLSCLDWFFLPHKPASPSQVSLPFPSPLNISVHGTDVGLLSASVLPSLGYLLVMWLEMASHFDSLGLDPGLPEPHPHRSSCPKRHISASCFSLQAPLSPVLSILEVVLHPPCLKVAFDSFHICKWLFSVQSFLPLPQVKTTVNLHSYLVSFIYIYSV